MKARPFIDNTLDEQVRRPELTRLILDRLGGPDHAAYNIVVTGSKGKGSTAVMLANLLQDSGYRVGLFTGPHLVRFTERIRVNGTEIRPGRLVQLARRVKQVADPLAQSLARDEYVSPVGLTAAIAALYFRKHGTDVNVWECGRGGLYDDVNQVRHETAVITPVFGEHLAQLGPTLDDVVRHKLGIVTHVVKRVYIGRQSERVERLMGTYGDRFKGRAVFRFGDGVHVNGVRTALTGTVFSVDTPNRQYTRLYVPVVGTFQADNAALALITAQGVLQDLALRRNSSPPGKRMVPLLSEPTVRKSLARVVWPGRLQIVSREPLVLIDGSIHRSSAAHVSDVLRQYSHRGGVVVVSVPKNKDYQGVLRQLAPLARLVIWTSAVRSDEALPDDLLPATGLPPSQVQLIADPYQAFQRGLSEIRLGEWLAIVGTQTLVGAAVQFFQRRSVYSCERSTR